MKEQKGIALIIVIILFALLLSSGAYLLRFAFMDHKMAVSEASKVKAFYSAEGGVEWARTKLSSNPDWFTDLPHTPADDITWLLKDAAGFNFLVGDAHCKIVRENGKYRFYSIGYLGDKIKGSRGVSVIRIDFSNPPFNQLSWRQI